MIANNEKVMNEYIILATLARNIFFLQIVTTLLNVSHEWLGPILSSNFLVLNSTIMYLYHWNKIMEN